MPCNKQIANNVHTSWNELWPRYRNDSYRYKNYLLFPQKARIAPSLYSHVKLYIHTYTNTYYKMILDLLQLIQASVNVALSTSCIKTYALVCYVIRRLCKCISLGVHDIYIYTWNKVNIWNVNCEIMGFRLFRTMPVCEAMLTYRQSEPINNMQ